MSAGRYVVLEGIEGAGKSTIASRLAAALREDGHDVVEIREPGSTAVGEGIRQLLLDPGHLAPWTEALLFAAQRAQIAEEVATPALAAGKWVVGDRSVYSSLAYQGGARGLGIERVRAVNEAGLGEVWPDLVVLLRLGVSTGLGRQEVADRIGGESAAFQESVAAAFDRLASAEPDRFVVIPAEGPIDAVADAVIEAVRGRW